MNKYDLVIFDLDGTILDTSEGIILSIKHTIDVMGLDKLSDTALSSFIGPPIQNSFERECGLVGEKQQEAVTTFREYYKTSAMFKASPYDGIYDTFQALSERKVMTAVATYKREDYAKSLLEYFEFNRFTHNIHGGDAENKLKKNDIINLCIFDSGIADKSRIVMVGDTCHDADGAEQACIDFIGVTFGFGFKSKADAAKCKSVGYAEKAADILKYI